MVKANIEGRATKAVKQAMLASNCFATGVSTLEHYVKEESKPQIVDLVISNLPPTTKAEELKKFSGVKHVINSVVDEDNFLGTCRGTGRI